MSDRTGETASQSPSAGKLYDAQGQIIHGTNPARRRSSGTGQLADFIREQPISAVLHAFSIGYILAKVI